MPYYRQTDFESIIMFHFQLGVIVSNALYKFNKNVMKNDVTGVKDISAAACFGSLTAGSGGALQAHSKRLNNKHNIPAIWYRFMFVPLFAFDKHTPQHIKALWGKIMK